LTVRWLHAHFICFDYRASVCATEELVEAVRIGALLDTITCHFADEFFQAVCATAVNNSFELFDYHPRCGVVFIFAGHALCVYVCMYAT